MKISEPYSLTVDRTRSLNAMIEAGSYDYTNADITADHFPVIGTGIREAEPILVHFGRDISTDAALAELDRWGYRPGDLPDLLAFGEQHPDFQRQFPIVELASVWTDRGGDRDVAFLWSYAGGRDLHLSGVAGDWADFYRFLAFRKS